MKLPDRPRRTCVVSFLSFGLGCFLIGGCAVDEKKEISLYRTVIDGAKAQPEYKPGEFLSLEGALVLANRHDESLASSGEDYLQALINKERAFASFLPTLQFAPDTAFVDHRGTNAVTSSGVSAPTSFQRSFTDAPVNANYKLFSGFGDIANYRQAGFTAQQRRALLLDLQQTTLLNVAQTYYAVLTNQRSVIVLLNSVALQNARVSDMEGRLAAGVARPLDVAQSRAQAAATRAQLTAAQSAVRTSRIALAFLTNAPVQDAVLEDIVYVPKHLAPQDDLVKHAEKTRQDVQAAESAVEAARQSVQAAISQYYPSVCLNLEYWLHKESLSTLWEGIFQFNVPIFTGGIIDANVRTAFSQLRQAWLNQERTRRLVSEQLRTAYESVVGARLQLVDLEIEVSAAHDAFVQADASYRAGLATNLDVLTAIDQENTARLSLETERLNYKFFYLQLIRSQGKLERPEFPFVDAADEFVSVRAGLHFMGFTLPPLP